VGADAGFDAVELHFGHDYLVSAFLTPRLTPRQDAFGGDTVRRAEVARRTATAVRERVGDRVAVLAKLTMHDGARGGIRPEHSLVTARLLQDDGAVDALVLTGGSSLLNPMFLFRGDPPLREFAAAMRVPVRWGIRMSGERFFRKYPFEEAYLLPLARQFRAELTMPLVLLGGVTNRATLDLAMAEGFQFAAMARALLREPDLVGRLQRDPATTSACIHCNQCMPTIYRGTHCTLAPAASWTTVGTGRA
jgi:2,4-dienoyl-CoA reductase-like NADH-dependent reductase (Old Yellow Enzyme family)